MNRYRQPLIVFISFILGTAVFMYQILWMRMLSLIVGTTTVALAIVVAVFLGGMGLGGLFFGYRADRTRSPGRLFALSSIGTAFFAVIILIILNSSPYLYEMIRQIAGLRGISVRLIIAVSTILMILPTFFMGATLPLLGRVYISSRARIGRGIGWLYAIYILGNITGACMTSYVFIPFWGHTYTTLIAVGINISAGLIAMVLPRFFQYDVTGNAHPSRRYRHKTPAYSSVMLLIIAGITGFAGLAFEILWTRVLNTYIVNSTYSFTNVLIIYLAGISSGSFLYFKVLYRKSKPWVLSTSQFLIGYYTFLMLIVINVLPNILFWMKDLLKFSVLRIALPGVTLSLVITFIPAVCMGVSFPLLCHLYTNHITRLGRQIGRLYFVNMCGSIVGSIVAGLFLIRMIGLAQSIGIIALITCGNALLALVLERTSKQFRQKALIFSAVFAGGVLLFLASFRYTMILPPSLTRSAFRDDEVLYYRETLDGTIIVTEDTRSNIRACYINNNAVCGTTYDALKVVRMLGHLPYLLNPTAQKACVIGFGIGITTSSLAAHDVESIDCIEICPGVAEATRFFSDYNNNILGNEKICFIPGDGRIHLLTTSKKYDIISCDPTHPTLGCNNLYTQDYFKLCKDRLMPGGVVCQYLPLHKLSLREFKIAIRTFHSVFPYITIWLAHAHAIMAGTLNEQELDFKVLSELCDSIDDPIIHDPYDLAISIILDNNGAQRFTGKGLVNTDNCPHLEFFSPTSTTKDNWDRNLYEILRYRVASTVVIQNVPDPVRLERYRTAQRYFLSALIYKNRGDLDAMIEAMKIAHRINPQSEEIRLFLEHEISQFNRSNAANQP